VTEAPPSQATPEDVSFMRLALAEANKARAMDEVPIGAVVVYEGRVVGTGFNQSVVAQDPTAHAEVLALRAAARSLLNYRLPGTTVYATVEPCLMCVGALLSSRIERLVYGASEPKFGAVRSLLDVSALAVNHRFEVTGGVLEEDCRSLMVEFFRDRRG
jgi:tRNA(adenine34) deaminase